MTFVDQKSWINIPFNSDFPLQNIPFGIFSSPGTDPRPATRIGDTVVDLSVLADHGYFDDLPIEDLTVFYEPVLNRFIGLGKHVTRPVRERIISLFSMDNSLRIEVESLPNLIYPVGDVSMHMPVKVPNYTDFYASEQHAYNVGVMFRDPSNALLPNWKHIPVGYHGRASSIVISGTPIHRPKGQTRPDDHSPPVFGPTRQLDFELEMGFVIGQPSSLGSFISTSNAESHIFGLVLFNDLSARDIQKWEYVPLGPFLSKNFGSVVSPWIITLEALEPFRVPGPAQAPEVMDYLKFTGLKHYDVNLEVALIPGTGNGSGTETSICKSNFRHLYWNLSQMLAHHTVNGCNTESGDIYGTGTISGPQAESFGSMLELAWKGTRPLMLTDGSSRVFLEDHDTVIFRGWAEMAGLRIGFGECRTQILPAEDR